MGCGTSLLAGERAPEPIVRDLSDFNLEYLELQPVGIVELDGVFEEVETILNSVVELNNGINDVLGDIKAAYAACAGTLTVETRVGGAVHFPKPDPEHPRTQGPCSGQRRAGGGSEESCEA